LTTVAVGLPPRIHRRLVFRASRSDSVFQPLKQAPALRTPAVATGTPLVVSGAEGDGRRRGEFGGGLRRLGGRRSGRGSWRWRQTRVAAAPIQRPVHRPRNTADQARPIFGLIVGQVRYRVGHIVEVSTPQQVGLGVVVFEPDAAVGKGLNVPPCTGPGYAEV